MVKVIGQPEPEVKWYRDDKPLSSTPKVNIVKKEDVHTVTIKTVTLKQGGLYKCVATNIAGKAEHSATITIKGTLTTSLCLCKYTLLIFFLPSL